MLRTLLLIVAIAMSGATLAADLSQVDKTIPLKDGTTLYIFKDGKMAMEDQYGRATRMTPDKVMETRDGQKIIMHGDEVMRLDNFLNPRRRNG